MFKKSESGRNVVEMIAIIVLMALLIAFGLWGFRKASLSAKVNTMTKDMSTAITERRYQIAQGGTGKEHPLNTKVGSTQMKVENVTKGIDRGQFTVVLSAQDKDTCEEMKKFNIFTPEKIMINDVKNGDCAQVNAMAFYFDPRKNGNGGDDDPLSGLKCPSGYVQSCGEGKYITETQTLTDGKKCYKCDDCPTATCPTDCTCTDGTNIHGCLTKIATCNCPTGYSKTACVPGTNYETGKKTLGNGDVCYQCTACETPTCPTGCTCTGGTDSHSCATQIPTSCTCSAGYYPSCTTGTNYPTGLTETLADGNTCIQCTPCPGNETVPTNACYDSHTNTGTNGCPSYTTYTTRTCQCNKAQDGSEGYIASCGTGKYITGTQTLADNTKCYQCANCPTSESVPTSGCYETVNHPATSECPAYTTYTTKACCPTSATVPTGVCYDAVHHPATSECPAYTTYTTKPCTCPTGYSKTTCVNGTNYQTASQTLADGSTCYQCTTCPGNGTIPTNACYDAHINAGTNGCPSYTTYTTKACTCPSTYVTACGTNQYITGTQTLANNTKCYQCANCPTSGTVPSSGCYDTIRHIGTNGCPDYYTYTTKTCCPNSESKPTSGCYNTVNHPAANGCPAYTTYTTKACTCSGCNACQKCNTTNGQCETNTSKNNQSCGTCGKCSNGRCQSYTKTGTYKTVNSNGCCVSGTKSYCSLTESLSTSCTNTCSGTCQSDGSCKKSGSGYSSSTCSPACGTCYRCENGKCVWRGVGSHCDASYGYPHVGTNPNESWGRH